MQSLYPSSSIKVKLKVFVYGTLKPGGRYWPQYCEGKVEKWVPAKAKGLLYHLKPGYPGMTKVDDSWVSGYLLSLISSTVLEGFDALEGFDLNRDAADNEYNRELTNVYSLSGRLLGKAWVYYMSKSKVAQMKGVLMPTGFWNQDSFNGLKQPVL